MTPPSEIALAEASPVRTERPDRVRVIAFVGDQDTETALREGLVEALPEGFEIRRGTLRAAMAALQKMPTPHVLIVDISGEQQPLSALGELSDVVEPDVRVLVIGDRDDLNFYRQVTRGLGVLEYLYQPLMRDMVARYFGPLVARHAPVSRACKAAAWSPSPARAAAPGPARSPPTWPGISASRRGATPCCWTPICIAARRRCMLGARTGPGLRTALEAPDRIDELFVERAAQPVDKRLHVLAGEEKLTDSIALRPNAAARLLDALRKRYNFVVIDVPCSALPLHRDLLMLAHQRVLVMDPTLASVRDMLRLMALPNGPHQPRRGVLVLNRDNMPRRAEPPATGRRAEDEARRAHSRPAQGGRPCRQHGRGGGGGARRLPRRDAATGAGGRVRSPAGQRHAENRAAPAAAGRLRRLLGLKT